MIKILQYGEGNFLRTFADAYFDTINEEHGGRYEVNVVKPTPFGSLEAFEKQRNRYHIVLRGAEKGRRTERVREIRALGKVFSHFENPKEYYDLARDKDLRLIVSNTTEAGIRFNAADDINDFAGMSYLSREADEIFIREI